MKALLTVVLGFSEALSLSRGYICRFISAALVAVPLFVPSSLFFFCCKVAVYLEQRNRFIANSFNDHLCLFTYWLVSLFPLSFLWRTAQKTALYSALYPGWLPAYGVSPILPLVSFSLSLYTHTPRIQPFHLMPVKQRKLPVRDLVCAAFSSHIVTFARPCS